MANLHTPKLTAAAVKSAKPGKYTDGHGLTLWVKPSRIGNAPQGFLSAIDGETR